MLKEYCFNCGSPNEYLSSKPKFCGGCGKILSAVASAVKPAPAPVVIPKRYTEEEPIDEYEEKVPRLTGLEVKIQAVRPQGEKFEQVARQQKTGFSRPTNKKFKKKDVLEEIRRESSNTEEVIDIGGNGED
jgi:hypothetical protein